MNQRDHAKLRHPASKNRVDAAIRTIEQNLGMTAPEPDYPRPKRCKRKWWDWWGR